MIDIKEIIQNKNNISIYKLIGGAWGIIYAILPSVVFMSVYCFSYNNPIWACGGALLTGIIFCAISLCRKKNILNALAGLLASGMSCAVVAITDSGTNNFVLSILSNGISALILLLTLLIKKPFASLLIASYKGDLKLIKKDKVLFKSGLYITLIWFFIAFLRFCVQYPIYLHSLGSNSVILLGVIKIIMGVPLLAVGCAFTIMFLKPIYIEKA